MAEVVTTETLEQPGDVTPVEVDEPIAPAEAAPADPDPVEGFWKDDWREQYAGEDQKALKALQRYNSPKAALDGLFAAKQAITSGNLAPKLGENPSEEEVQKYRDALGIPKSPDEYEIKLSNDRKIEDGDKEQVKGIVEKLHSLHAKPDVVNAVLDMFYDLEDSAYDNIGEADDKLKASTEDELRKEWGGDYRRNMNGIMSLLDGAPDGVKEALMGARGPEGTMLINEPSMARWLSGLSREINPVATLLPGVSNPQAAVGEELAKLQKMMGDHTSDYWKGPNADNLQKRYRELISFQSKAA